MAQTRFCERIGGEVSRWPACCGPLKMVAVPIVVERVARMEKVSRRMSEPPKGMVAPTRRQPESRSVV